jgi:hypothetical protein
MFSSDFPKVIEDLRGHMDRDRDKDQKKTPSQTGRPLNDALAQQILGSLTSAYSGAETVRWLKNLNADFPLQTGGAGVAKSGEPMKAVSIVNHLFNDFERYAIEFNKTISDPDSRITCEQPQSSHFAAEQGEEPVICQGHLSTVSWALVVQAQEHKILVYIVPSDRLLGFRMQRSAFSSYMEINGDTVAPGMTMWKVANVNLTTQNLSRLSKKLFGHLFRVLNGLVPHTDKFVGDFTTLSATSLVLSTAKDTFAAKYDSVGAEQSTPHSPPNPGLAQPLDYERLLHRAAGNPNGPTDSHADLEENTRAILHMLNEFSKTVDRELQSLTQKGASAMHNQDIVYVQIVAKRAAALQRFREIGEKLVKDWRESI